MKAFATGAVAAVLAACGAASPPPAAPVQVPAPAPASRPFACFEVYLGADEGDDGALLLPGPSHSAWVTGPVTAWVTGPLTRRVRVTEAGACQVIVQGIWSVCYHVDAEDIAWLKELRADGNEVFAALAGWNASACFGPEGYLANWHFDGQVDAAEMASWMSSGTLPPERPPGPPRSEPGTHVLHEHRARAGATPSSRASPADRIRPK